MRALVRDPRAAEQQLPEGDITLAVGDVTQYDSLVTAMAGCDAIICATGTSGIRQKGDPLAPFNIDYQVRLDRLQHVFERCMIV